MRTRVVKLHQKWVVEFPFAVTVYCDRWEEAIDIAVNQADRYLLATSR